jgi:hypothetical protein
MDKDIKFSQAFKKLVTDVSGIRQNQVVEALVAPDKTDGIDFHGADLKVHTKLIGSTNPPSTLLVVESNKAGERTVNSAFRIYPELAGNRSLEALKPLDILRLLTDSFGLLIRVGKQTGKLVLCESFQYNKNTNLNLVEGLETPRGSMIQEIYFKVDDGDPATAYCAMAFAIDTDHYSAWLKSIARRTN